MRILELQDKKERLSMQRGISSGQEPSTKLTMRTPHNEQKAAAAAAEKDSMPVSSRKRSSLTTASSTKHNTNENSRGIQDGVPE
jgi:hypothetical protein